MADPKDGRDTTEFAITKGVNLIGMITMILGFLMQVGETIVPMLGDGTQAGGYAGAALIIIGGIMKVFTTMGYQSSRTKVKAAAALADAKRAEVAANASEGGS